MKTRQLFITLALILIGLVLTLTLPQLALADGPIYVDWDAPGPTHDGLSWTTAYTSVQDGLDAAVPGDEIWVAEGIYTPTYQTDAEDARTATFVLTNTVPLYGGFGGYGTGETQRGQRDWETHVTVLSGDLDGNDITDPNGVVTDTDNINGNNAYHVVTGSGVTETAVLDGFTITGGQTFGSGGGMYNSYGNPRLANVTFSGNGSYWKGGGMANYYSDPTLTNITFSGNTSESGGGMYNSYGNPQLAKVTFSSNAAGSGGGMYTEYGNPTLTHVTFKGNSAYAGGGMFNRDSSTLTHVTFDENQAYSGGGLYNTGNPTLTKVIFSNNHANSSGGGIFSHSDIMMTNITFSGNHANGIGGGGMLNYNSHPTLTNCILWGNTASSDPQIAGTATVNYSLVEGGYSGTGNLDTNPLFADFDGTDNITGTLDDNLRLLPTSPAIDAGNNTAVPTDTLDLDGDGITNEPVPFDLDSNPRFVDMPSQPDTGNGSPPIVDMGAFETAPYLILVKTVNTERVTAVPLGGVVTYTLVIRNHGDSVISGVVVTDPMPSGLTFGAWLNQGSAQLPPPITWGPSDVAAHTEYTISFTANVTENINFVGQVITNTAYFTAANHPSGASNPATFTLNQSPVADAGEDQTAIANSTVTLNGSGSYDPDGDDLSYGWMQVGDETGINFTPNVSVTTFTAPGSTVIITFTLTVTDTSNLTDTSITVISVTENYSIYLPLILKTEMLVLRSRT